MNKLLLLPIVLLLASCSDIVVYNFKHDIVSVYYHERGKYSVGEVNNGLLKIKSLPYGAHVDIWMDVSPEDEKWYECDYTYDTWDSDKTGGCSIHIHDIDDIGTAGWSHGKFGSGTTVRID